MKSSIVLPFLMVASTATAVAPAKLLRGGARELEEEDCNIDFSLSCKVFHRDDGSVQDCDTFSFPPTQMVDGNSCTGPPETATFLYNGGNCSQTETADVLEISCLDGALGSPPTEEGERSYIVVTNPRNYLAVYHGAFVKVGDEFEVHDGGNLLDSGFVTRIYDNASRQRKLLQEVRYERSFCNNTLELDNRFGATQLKGYSDEYEAPTGFDDVKRSANNNRAYEVMMHLTMSLADGTDKRSVSIEQASALTSFHGVLDLTGAVKNQVVTPLQPLSVSIPVDLDMAERRHYRVLAQVTGRGGSCTSKELFHFVAGSKP